MKIFNICGDEDEDFVEWWMDNLLAWLQQGKISEAHPYLQSTIYNLQSTIYNLQDARCRLRGCCVWMCECYRRRFISERGSQCQGWERAFQRWVRTFQHFFHSFSARFPHMKNYYWQCFWLVFHKSLVSHLIFQQIGSLYRG